MNELGKHHRLTRAAIDSMIQSQKFDWSVNVLFFEDACVSNIDRIIFVIHGCHLSVKTLRILLSDILEQ